MLATVPVFCMLVVVQTQGKAHKATYNCAMLPWFYYN